jgi:F0F1-type ATP synthase membrane subunit b/b'
MEIKERIDAAKAKLDKAARAKTIAETQLEAAVKQCDDIVADMQKHGVDPETIGAEIEKLTAKVNTELTEIENAIPEV